MRRSSEGRAHCTAVAVALAVAVTPLVTAGGCGGDGGPTPADRDGGTAPNVVLRINGGNEARGGIPASAFRDGWSVRIDHAIVEFQDFRLAASDGSDAGLRVDPVLVELVPNPRIAWEIAGVPAQRWDLVSWRNAPPPPDVRTSGVDPALARRMVEEGYSMLLSGVLIAPPGGSDRHPAEVPFEFGFPVEVVYERCDSGDGTRGLAVPRGGVAEPEVTWHLTHAWFDSYAEDAGLRAEAMAAVAPGDGSPLRIEHLATQPLTRLVDRDGRPLVDADGYPVVYIPGSTGARTLADFVLAARFGHFNGLEGGCTTTLRVLRMPTTP
jgi:hypothetical protein